MLEPFIAAIAEVGQMAWHKGWAERNAGNISVNLTDEISVPARMLRTCARVARAFSPENIAGACILVTRTGSRFRDIARSPRENLLLVRIADKLDGYHILWGGAGAAARPTSELAAHVGIHSYMRRHGQPHRAVVHTHPTELIVLTHTHRFQSERRLTRMVWSMHPETKIFIADGLGYTRYIMPGSDRLAQATIEELSNHRLVLWEKHGCIAVGPDVLEAFDLIDTANKAAQIYLMSRAAGLRPVGLTARQRRDLARHFPK